MRFPRRFKFVGGRVVKTGLAVFVTALICHLLNWPAMFAVITAIVTIEPTAADSIKKAFIRFPASAIGAGFSVLATFLFGDSPISYTFVALATIITCHKLKLEAGILVATLTGIAMISTVHDEYLSSFFVRLGTTSTGLIVSSLVNFLVMPPNYSQPIHQGVDTLCGQTGDILKRIETELFSSNKNEKQLRKEFYNVINGIEKIDTLCKYQKDGWKFHSFRRENIKDFHDQCKKLDTIRQMTFHIGKLIYLPAIAFEKGGYNQRLISETIHSLNNILHDSDFTITDHHRKKIKTMKEIFAKQKSFEKLNSFDHGQFLPETIILYEILSINELVVELNKVQAMKNRQEAWKGLRKVFKNGQQGIQEQP